MIRRWIEKLKNPEIDLYERRYTLMSPLSSAELVVMVAVYLIAGFPFLPVLFYLICAVLSTIDYLRTGAGTGVQTTTVKGSVFFVFVYIPFGFFLVGGMEGGAVHWSIMALAYIFLTVRGRARDVMLLFDCIVTVICIAVCFIRPDFCHDVYTETQMYINHVLLFAIDVVTLGSGFLFQVYTAEQERAIVEKQRDELIALNRARVASTYVNRMQSAADELFAAGKKRLIVSCDSAADLPQAWYAQWKIRVIPHVLDTGGGVFFDKEEIDCDELMYHLKKGGTAVSRVPDVADFERFFAQLLREGDIVIHISVAADASAVFSRAKEAAAHFDGVRVLDSGSMSAGSGLLALYAAHLVQKGETDAEEIIARLEQIRTQISARFVLEGTDELVRGRRMAPLLGRWLDAFLIRPAINMKNGRMHYFISAGRNHRALFIRRVLSWRRYIDTSLLVITHTSLPEEEVAWIRNEVERHVVFDRVVCIAASGAIAVNTGAGTFGLIFRLHPDRGTSAGGLFDFLPEDLRQISG